MPALRSPSRHGRTRRRLLAAVGCALILAAGCDDGGGGGDPAAFCEVVEGQLAQVDDPFAVLESGDPEEIRSTMAQLLTFFDRAADTAPEQIEEEVRALRSALREVVDVLEDHDFDVAAAEGALRESALADPEEILQLREAADALNAYAIEQCDLPSESTTTSPTTAPPA